MFNDQSNFNGLRDPLLEDLQLQQEVDGAVEAPATSETDGASYAAGQRTKKKEDLGTLYDRQYKEEGKEELSFRSGGSAGDSAIGDAAGNTTKSVKTITLHDGISNRGDGFVPLESTQKTADTGIASSSSSNGNSNRTQLYDAHVTKKFVWYGQWIWPFIVIYYSMNHYMTFLAVVISWVVGNFSLLLFLYIRLAMSDISSSHEDRLQIIKEYMTPTLWLLYFIAVFCAIRLTPFVVGRIIWYLSIGYAIYRLMKYLFGSCCGCCCGGDNDDRNSGGIYQQLENDYFDMLEYNADSEAAKYNEQYNQLRYLEDEALPRLKLAQNMNGGRSIKRLYPRWLQLSCFCLFGIGIICILWLTILILLPARFSDDTTATYFHGEGQQSRPTQIQIASIMCNEHRRCNELGLQGRCCPTYDGVFLGCCQ